MTDENKLATASLENLYRIFSIPEQPESRLAQIDREIDADVTEFLRDRISVSAAGLDELEQEFYRCAVPENPQFVSAYTDFLSEHLLAHSVHTAAPGFIGHMTTPLPHFMLSLSRLMVALNQNPVKIETSKAFTAMERQVLGMLHNLVYQQPDSFYQHSLHNSEQALGSFCSGGTVANLSALWVARNRLFSSGNSEVDLAQDGLAAVLAAIDCRRLVVVASERAHYSVAKAVDILGIGRRNLVLIPTDADNRMDIASLEETLAGLQAEGARIMAVVGLAGATETGSVDPLRQVAELSREYQSHFHVDAAWGGPILFSQQHRDILAGIELADSVTIDAHKQMYVPMGAGMIVFRDPDALASIQHHAEYILRVGSKDLGRYTLEGSRPAMALLVHAALHILGRSGYELLMDDNMQRTAAFAEMIRQHPDFELMAAPQLNILNYRYVPAELQRKLAQASAAEQSDINHTLDKVTAAMQKAQRAAGTTFVSRTRYPNKHYGGEAVSVFRAVLANPMTTEAVLQQVLDEQSQLGEQGAIQSILKSC